MILSDRDIINEMMNETVLDTALVITPYENWMQQPASVDLQLSTHFQLFAEGFENEIIDPFTQTTYRMAPYEVPEGQPFILRRGEFVLGSTIQRVEIPSWLVGRLEGKSSLARLGISIHSTAGFIDPGYQGHITLEIKNDAPRDVLLWPRMPVAQLSIHRLSRTALRPYGSEGLGSKYQDSVDTVESRYHANSGIPSPADTSS